MNDKNFISSDDSINRLFSVASEFHNMTPNLINAESFEDFQIWFKKLELLDRRMLILYFRKYHSLFKDEYVLYAENRLKRKIRT